jgi:hypothetical protein
MKRIYNQWLLLLFVIGTLSCNDVSLDTVPSDFIAPEYYYNDENQMNAALNGVYSVLASAGLYNLDGNSLFSAFNQVDEMFRFTSGTNQLENYDYDSSHAGPNQVYTALYRGVERANMLLKNIGKPQMNDSVRNVIKGEAQFLRAYYYFDLVRNFGDVILRTEPTASVADVNYVRTPAGEVYDFVIKEMEEAESLVPSISSYRHSGKITKSAVQAVLARVCLHKAGFPNNDVAKYTDALKWAEKVINSGLHSLNPDYSQFFINTIQDKYDTRESIWEVELYSTGATDVYRRYGSWGAANGIRQLDVSLGYSNGGRQVHANLYYKYANEDLRRDWAIASYRWKDANGQLDRGTIKQPWLPAEIYERRPGKWRREYELTVQKVQNYTSTNCIVMRYSDVLLMAAEAENELNGPTNKAINYVNQVRRRAYGNGQALRSFMVTNGGSGYTSAPTVTISGGGAVNTGGLAPASATATISDGQVIAVNLVDRGTFYTSAPTVTISGGGGSGATVTAQLAPVTDADLLPEQVAGKSAFLKTIQDERARELCFEGWRRNDLIRWGIFVSTLQALATDISLNAPSSWKSLANYSYKNVADKHIYIPIPLRELQLNPLLVQTEGW